MTQRLTEEAEADARSLDAAYSEQTGCSGAHKPCFGKAAMHRRALLAEVDALRAELQKANLSALRATADLATERAETARLNATLLDYWGTYGCVAADNGRFQAMLAEAERRGREAERADVVAHLRELNYEWVPSMIERGDHVRSPGTPAPGAAKDPA